MKLKNYWVGLGKFEALSKGKQRGKIGFPTCNINLNEYIVTRLGVYSIIAETDSFEKL